MPPKAKKLLKELTIHGHKRIDNYYWLNDRENPDVISYLQEENDYLKTQLAHTNNFQKSLFDEITARIKEDDQSVPYFANGYFYYVRYEKGLEYPIYCRKKEHLTSKEEIILDVNVLAKGQSYFHVTGLSVSPDNMYLAYGVDNVSRRIYTIYFKNLNTGKLFSDTIENTTGNCVWANDNETVFYTVKDETLRPYKVVLHKLSANSEENDLVIYEEKDSTFAVYLGKSKSHKYIFISCWATLSSEIRYIDADRIEDGIKIINPREADHLYSVVHFEDEFYIHTNWQAKNFCLMKTNISTPSKKYWQKYIPHRQNVLLSEIEVFKDFMVLEERENGLVQLQIINQKTQDSHYLQFDEATYSANISINREYNTTLFRYSYTSLTTPNSTFDYNMETQEKTLLKQAEVVGSFNKSNYKLERIFSVAEDGTRIPISLVYKKGLKLNGENPALIYGYGSYGYSMEASFSSVRLSLLDRGFVYAIAHIRGGEEMGRYWYENGKLLKKMNTFTDFISCAETLIAKRFTCKEKLFAMGGSAGGLLMGAIINLRPDLWKAVVAAVPFVDVVTTMLDESIPLTTGEFDEWGNPKEKLFYDYILSYSPYDNVQKKEYPAMLVTTGLHDSQVQYWEPAKWVAKLRDLKTDSNPLYLFTEMEAGHGGASGRFEKYKTVALEYAFILDIAGMKK